MKLWRYFERLNQLSKDNIVTSLCKDFIIDKFKIDVAKRAGASINVNILK